MPHQCTNCGRTFPDGSKEMLSGCPDCGGNKFQFQPSGTIELDDDGSVSSDSAPASPRTEREASESSSTADAPSPSTAEEDRPSKEWVGLDEDDGSDDSTAPSESERTDPVTPSAEAATDADGDIIEADEEPERVDAEDRAQADARRTTVTPDEVADAGAMPPDADSRVIEPQSDERPDISELREELNEQFESIKILSPGTYELNLMELYDREEYIISLQEDGRYVIEVPDAWRGGEE
jgi:predicted  nucleic acid-binding Zn-ribbon protein